MVTARPRILSGGRSADGGKAARRAGAIVGGVGVLMMSCGESSDPARWRLRYRRGTAKECLRAKQRYEVSPLRVTYDQMEEEGGTVDSCVLVFSSAARGDARVRGRHKTCGRRACGLCLAENRRWRRGDVLHCMGALCTHARDEPTGAKQSRDLDTTGARVRS
jgi:hypothetical protein